MKNLLIILLFLLPSVAFAALPPELTITMDDATNMGVALGSLLLTLAIVAGIPYWITKRHLK